MTKSANERRDACRQAVAGLSLVVFLAAVMGIGGIFLFRDLPVYLGFDIERVLSGWELLGFGSLALIAIVILVYAAVTCWLVFARLFLTRAEVLKIACFGPTTGFDRWLINQFFPESKDDVD